MKALYQRSLLLLCILLLISFQKGKTQEVPMLGDLAPSFKAETSLGDIAFPEDYFGNWKLLFCHPADFTPVCATEILDLAEMQEEFEELNAQIVVLSADGLNSHLQWIKSLEQIQKKEGKAVGINFPLVPDVGLEISRQYGMIHSKMSTTKTIRGVYIINPENVICAIFFYPLNIGRNQEEIKRTLIALQESDKHDVFTPSNWQPGDDFLMPSPSSREEAEKLAKKNNPKLYSKDWYLWYLKNKN